MLVLDTSGSLAGERCERPGRCRADGSSRPARRGCGVPDHVLGTDAASRCHRQHDRPPLAGVVERTQRAWIHFAQRRVFLACSLRPLDAVESRPVLLVFSDGRDNTSWLRASSSSKRRGDRDAHPCRRAVGDNQWARCLRAVGLCLATSPIRQAADDAGLRKLPRSARLFGKALNELRARYLLTYSP